ncbi:hypothetical protein ACIRBY_16090 [Streptomyces sp. NPDC096136]|uniref:hypothetical protein n=1 Tax=Streptomyces sp. NPDC096136 TaxID=3366076 RepID=UPI003808DBF8
MAVAWQAERKGMSSRTGGVVSVVEAGDADVAGGVAAEVDGGADLLADDGQGVLEPGCGSGAAGQGEAVQGEAGGEDGVDDGVGELLLADDGVGELLLAEDAQDAGGNGLGQAGLLADLPDVDAEAMAPAGRRPRPGHDGPRAKPGSWSASAPVRRW